MTFVVGNLPTGRIRQTIIQRHLQLNSVLLKGVQGDLQGPKLKLESDNQGRCVAALTGNGGFSPLGDLMTINHLCQQKAFFQFSYQMKARVNMELTWRGAFLVSGLKLRPGRGEGGYCGPEMELPTWGQCGSAAQWVIMKEDTC